MAQLLVVKNDDPDRVNFKGDVVGYVSDIYILDEENAKHFELIPVSKFSKKELYAALCVDMPETKPVWQASTVEWTLKKPVRKDAWKDGDTWKFINVPPKHQFNVAHFTEQQIATLASAVATKEEKALILTGADSIKKIPENDEVIPRIVKAVEM